MQSLEAAEVVAFVEAGTGGEAAVAAEAETVPQQAGTRIKISNPLHSQGRDSTRVLSILTFPQETGQAARCISVGGARQIFVLNLHHVLGAMSLHLRINEGPTSSAKK